MPKSEAGPTVDPGADLPRRLGLIDALSIVIGVTIGGGIFLVPNLVAQELKSSSGIIAVWVFAGVISFFGALACAELGCALPATGGQYVYLREACGPLVGFLCGWSMFTMARTTQVAWLAATLAMYVSYFIPLSPIESKLLGSGVMILRRKQPDLPRPYHMWGYPITAIMFLAITGWFLVNMLWTRPLPSLAGLLLVATGISVYFIWARRGRRVQPAALGELSSEHVPAEAQESGR